MKIQVWKRYTENRAKEPIEEGIYEQSDKKLFGLARYLIDNGNARVFVEATAPGAVPLIEVDPQELVEAFVKSVDEMGEALVESEEQVAEGVAPDWPRIEDEARDLTVENDKIREANAKPKPKRTRKAKS